MRKPLNKIELYAALKPLQPKMAKFKETDNASLTAEEVKLLQDVYPDVQVLTSGALPLRVNVGCPTCIREIFHVFASLFDRLESDPTVNPVYATEQTDKINDVVPEPPKLASHVAETFPEPEQPKKRATKKAQ